MNQMISIVTICFNSENEIERTMKSVLYQDYKYIEYVIKDGNSKDRTNRIVKKYQTLFQNKGIYFQHIISEDQGIYDAMNIAVKNCHGDWVIFMNSGDFFYNNTVVSDIFNNRTWHKADVIYGNTLFRLTRNRGIIANHDINLIENNWSMCHQSLFTRRELLQKFPFDSQYRIVADYDQALRLKRERCSFQKVNLIISVMDREGMSIKLISLRTKENNLLTDKYALKRKKRSIIIGYVKQVIRKILPELEVSLFVKKCLKYNVQFISHER